MVVAHKVGCGPTSQQPTGQQQLKQRGKVLAEEYHNSKEIVWEEIPHFLLYFIKWLNPLSPVSWDGQALPASQKKERDNEGRTNRLIWMTAIKS